MRYAAPPQNGQGSKCGGLLIGKSLFMRVSPLQAVRLPRFLIFGLFQTLAFLNRFSSPVRNGIMGHGVARGRLPL
jgi:hypothetical protein